MFHADRHVGPIIVIGQLMQEDRRRHRQQLCVANHSLQKGTRIEVEVQTCVVVSILRAIAERCNAVDAVSV